MQHVDRVTARPGSAVRRGTRGVVGRFGEAVVAVLVKGRPTPAVLADMIDGVVVANQLVGVEAADLREVLWIAVADLAAETPSPTADVRARRAA